MKATIKISAVVLCTLFVAAPLSAQEKETGKVEKFEYSFRKSAPEKQRVYTAFSTGSNDNGVYILNSESNASSQLSISKTFVGETKKNEGSFSVDNAIRHLQISLSGNVKEGSITVTIQLPGGEEYRKITIDDSADIMLNLSLSVKEGENRYIGKWKYSVDAKNATGSYRLTLNSN